MIENIFFEKILIIMLASVWVLVLINQLIKIRDQPLNVLFLTKNLHHCKNFRNDLETRKKRVPESAVSPCMFKQRQNQN